MDFFLGLSLPQVRNGFLYYGLLLRCATGVTEAYESVGVRISTGTYWHTAPESVVTLVLPRWGLGGRVGRE